MKKRKPKRITVRCYPDPHLPPVDEDFRKTFHKRLSRITKEFTEGFQFVSDFKRAVSVFGSTSFKPKNHYYQEARRLGRLLAKAGYTVITGGGPGIMEAANRGAFEQDGESVGINIQLPEGQRINPYVKNPIGFHYFFTRKVMLSFASRAYVFFPGGFGTLDEFFEMVTLVQTKKFTHPVTIIAVGREYWQTLFDWLKKEVYQKRGAIKKRDLEIFQLVDSAKEAFGLIESFSWHEKEA